MRKSLKEWKDRRFERVLKIVSQVDAQTLYDAAIEQAFDAGRAKTGVQFFIPMVHGLRATDTTFVRRALNQLNVSMHHRDTCYLDRQDRFNEMPPARRQEVKTARLEGLRKTNMGDTVDYSNAISCARRLYPRIETAEEAVERYERARWFRRLSNDQQTLIRSRIAASWSRLSDKAHLERCTNISRGQTLSGNHGGPHKVKAIFDGIEITFDSSWEVSMFAKLRTCEIAFRYANLHDTCMQLRGKTWRPDFVIGNTIIEVKGHPKAYAKFYGKDLPAFLRSSHAAIYSVFLFEHDVAHWRYRDVKDLDALLSFCREVHRC